MVIFTVVLTVILSVGCVLVACILCVQKRFWDMVAALWAAVLVILAGGVTMLFLP